MCNDFQSYDVVIRWVIGSEIDARNNNLWYFYKKVVRKVLTYRFVTMIIKNVVYR